MADIAGSTSPIDDDARSVETALEGYGTERPSSAGTAATSVTSASGASDEEVGDDDDDGNDEEEGHIDDSSDEFDEFDGYKHLAGPLWSFVSARCESLLSKPENHLHDGNFDTFKARWRQHFADMRAARAAVDNHQPAFVTDPPLKKLDIEFIDDAGPHECPCCRPDHDPHILLRGGDGVTEDSFLEAVCEQLYGESVRPESLPLRDAYAGGLVPVEFMTTTHGAGSLYRLSGLDAFRIWVYCSRVQGRPRESLPAPPAKAVPYEGSE